MQGLHSLLTAGYCPTRNRNGDPSLKLSSVLEEIHEQKLRLKLPGLQDSGISSLASSRIAFSVAADL